MRIADLTSALTGELGRIVVDKTGLTANYNVTLNWTLDGKQPTAAYGASLFTALQEQLGLELVPMKAPVDTIVFDEVERPLPN